MLIRKRKRERERESVIVHVCKRVVLLERFCSEVGISFVQFKNNFLL